MTKAPATRVIRGSLILPDRVVTRGAMVICGGVIQEILEDSAAACVLEQYSTADVLDAGNDYIAPGYVDLHVHGGRGADFMDGTEEAFRTVLRAHAEHGTTSLCPTTTVARHDQILAALALCSRFRRQSGAGIVMARVLGAHFYGPYFNETARGCHPAAALRPPNTGEFQQYLEYAADMTMATVAPELPGAEAFALACRERGVRLNVGHSQATFAQMAAAVRWGARHVDHLYCAMSDKTKLRALRPYPMQGGVLEAAIYFDELTTEVIADGKHLSADLLLLAHKIKGPDKLALVTDCNRALDLPEGRYLFGPLNGGEPFDHRDGVGIMTDGQALASSTQGMDHMVRTFAALTGRPVWEAVRMASLTPARIAGWDDRIGSLAPGKLADFLVLDHELRVRRTFIGGQCVQA